jgi:mevalonate pyrophosphate decarboxylase
VFTPEELEKQQKAKSKEFVEDIKDMEVKKLISEEETNEFLKLMKHNMYSMVEQLKKTSAFISLISLILSSESPPQRPVKSFE